mgnify:CR=1 FL=1
MSICSIWLLLVLLNWICYLVLYCFLSLTSHRYFFGRLSVNNTRCYQKRALIHAKKDAKMRNIWWWKTFVSFVCVVASLGEVDDSSLYPLQIQPNLFQMKRGRFPFRFWWCSWMFYNSARGRNYFSASCNFHFEELQCFPHYEILKFSKGGAEKVKTP